MAVELVKYRFWDLEAALLLIKEHYSWFLPTFESYNSMVAKGEAAVCQLQIEYVAASP